MKIDLGCGKHPRGDINVDYGDFAVVTDTSPLDKYFEPYGFKYNPNAKIYDMRIETFLNTYQITKDDEILLSHVIEHLTNPFIVLQQLTEAKLIVIAIPNPTKNPADCIDKGHLYSWTKCALENLLSKIFKNHNIKITEINNIDLMAIITRKDTS